MKNFSTWRIFKLQWLVMLIASVAVPVYAEVPSEPKSDTPELVAPPWKLYDTDENGHISADEAVAQGMPARTFKSLDIDRDGRLNQDEFAKAPRIRLK